MTTMIDELAECVTDAIRKEAPLMEVGLEQDEFGQLTLKGECRITLYRVGGEWEIDIILPDGSAIGFDVPLHKVVIRKNPTAVC